MEYEYEYLSPYNGYPTLKINSYIFILKKITKQITNNKISNYFINV